ncbi:hypothetical protein A33O_06552 [Nitratireductor aquibiodomus RA22]|uniref:Uncharacterized protein n=1 Tax=Nitratireductor aquibiodomus RA22 TaxID=1189611 RepID=I5C2P5_9HYPH|nr:hypothetical protein [Nitratireductor aquibiodomus]EIM76097.1 hypothetical protein A33O_06552 [Nitratireductor aquibiodomus RA22]
MKTAVLAALATLILAAPAAALEPIKGSLNYNADQTALNKTPVGSVTFNEFHNGGNRYREVYVVDTDRRLKIVNRSVVDNS